MELWKRSQPPYFQVAQKITCASLRWLQWPKRNEWADGTSCCPWSTSDLESTCSRIQLESQQVRHCFWVVDRPLLCSTHIFWGGFWNQQTFSLSSRQGRELPWISVDLPDGRFPQQPREYHWLSHHVPCLPDLQPNLFYQESKSTLLSCYCILVYP